MASDLQGHVLSKLDPDTLEARRPEAPLRGWVAVIEAIDPSLVADDFRAAFEPEAAAFERSRQRFLLYD